MSTSRHEDDLRAYLAIVAEMAWLLANADAISQEISEQGQKFLDLLREVKGEHRFPPPPFL